MLRVIAAVLLFIPIIVSAGPAINPAMLGTWQGRAEFVAVDPDDETPIPLAHSVEQVSLRIDGAYGLSGIAERNGCALRGTVAPQPNSANDASVRIDVAVSRCKEAVLNRSYTGTLAPNRHMKTTELRLMVEDAQRVRYEIKGNLERQP